MGSSHLLNKGLPLGKHLPFLLHGATRESVICRYLSVRSGVVQYSAFPSPSSFPPPLLSAPLFPLSYYLSSEPFIHAQLLSAFSFLCEDSIRLRAGATDLWWLALLTVLIFQSSKDKKPHILSTLENLRGWQGHDSLSSMALPSHCAVEMWLPVPALTYFLISVSSKEILILEESKSGNT